MHPPQTYSRLFRPWDCNTHTLPVNPTISKAENSLNKHFFKSEISASSENMSAANTSTVKTENFAFSGNESERECASSNSSSSKNSSYEDQFNNAMQMQSPSALPSMVRNLVHPVPYGNTHLYGSLENHAPHLAAHLQHTSHATGMTHLMPPIPTLPASDLYYAAAAAANVLPPVPTTNSTAAAAAAAYAFDPYGMSLMGQEYLRVMTEDAHLKAVNARKQRPKKFKCPHCEVAFSNNGQLKGHIRIHTGERPFKCDVESCAKTFTRNEELTRHKRIHTGLRPYPCTACGKKFGRRDHLKKHMKTHMPQDRQLGSTIFVSMYPYLYGY